MKGLSAAWLVMVVTGIVGCASGGAQQRPSGERPEMKLVRATLASEIAPGGAEGPAWPARTESFSPTHPAAIAAVEFSDVRREHDVVFSWYSPDGALYLQSGVAAVRPSGGVHRRAVLWHSLNIAGERAAQLSGDWRVAVSLDGAVATTLDFSISNGD